MRRNDVAVQPLAFLGEPLDECGAVSDLAPGFRERLALLSGHQRGEVLLVRHQQFVPAAQDGGAFLGGVRGPRGKCARGRLDRLAGLGDSHVRHRAERLAGGGIYDRVGCAARRIEPLATDEGVRSQQIRITQFHEADSPSPGDRASAGARSTLRAKNSSVRVRASCAACGL